VRSFVSDDPIFLARRSRIVSYGGRLVKRSLLFQSSEMCQYNLCSLVINEYKGLFRETRPKAGGEFTELAGDGGE